MFRHQMYQKLGERNGEFLKLIESRATKVGVPKAWRGAIGLTGSNSARPAYFRAMIETEAARWSKLIKLAGIGAE